MSTETSPDAFKGHCSVCAAWAAPRCPGQCPQCPACPSVPPTLSRSSGPASPCPPSAAVAQLSPCSAFPALCTPPLTLSPCPCAALQLSLTPSTFQPWLLLPRGRCWTVNKINKSLRAKQHHENAVIFFLNLVFILKHTLENIILCIFCV